MNIAVVDLGSNTFHLLIVAPIDDTLQEIYRKRVYARLARSGIGLISDTAFQKGVDVLIEFKKEIDKHNVSRIKVVGTEMLRLAPNGGDFVRKVKEKTGFDIEIISGNQEAEYIFKGVEPLLPSGALLIMDIGGGSVEFIIVIDGKKKWLISLPIGIAVLYFDFQHSDPIQTPDLAVLEGFLAKKLKPLKNAIQRYPINELIGASGAFETFFDVLGYVKSISINSKYIFNIRKIIGIFYHSHITSMLNHFFSYRIKHFFS